MTQKFWLKILQACSLSFQPRSDHSGKWGNSTPLSGPRVLLLALALSSCGGGGGSSTPALSLSALLPWTWIGGSSTPNQPTTATTPGARISSATWTDSSGNFWMFGGEISSTSDTNDLWVYNPTTHTWTQENTSSSPNLPGVYGTRGAPGTGNLPGARNDSVSWIDHSGNLWLFGGYGYDSVGLAGELNDLWEYNPTAKTWTWVSGSNQANQTGVYGTRGTPSTSNVPGARLASVSWIDLTGNLWLFGGQGYAASGSLGDLNDLWEYTPGTGQWTWVSGSNQTSQTGVYGTQGTPSSSNVPGARHDSVAWTDSSGTLWLFGGQYQDPTTHQSEELNDLWEYAPGTGQWTWVSGSNQFNPVGSYGSSPVPGSRDSSVAWTDTSGNLWLFGGYGYASTSTAGELNDLWKFNLGARQWTWVNGGNQINQVGSYGSQPGTPGMPGARSSANAWFSTSGSGSLWLFGGWEGNGNYLNDLWQYTP